MAHASLRRLAAHELVGRAVDLVERTDRADFRLLRVLTYHRVDEPEPFASHVRHLAARYHVVSTERVLATLDGGPELPPRSVLLTFDDGYRSFAEVAWPILRRHGFGATLFVPTAYPDGDLPRFWWDRLAAAFEHGMHRGPLATPVGALALETREERARAHALVKEHVKDLPHATALATTDALCAALGVPGGPHEVLSWRELRALAQQGVTIGAHSRTHPRLDRVTPTVARAECLDSLADIRRELPGQPCVFAYPDGRFDDGLVQLLRAAGGELAFTTRRGTNDVARSDRLRLRRIPVDARDELQVFRAKLALGAARLTPFVRLLSRPTYAERREERANRAEHWRSRFLLRSLDAVLTAGLRSRELARPARSHYERIGRAAARVHRAMPGLAARLTQGLFDPSRLPLRASTLALAGFGSGTTVFRLGLADGTALALKVYRRTLGRAPHNLRAAARRYRQRYERLVAAFGDVVQPAHFLVLHAPLHAVPAVACLQRFLVIRDLLALADEELLALLRTHDGLAESFALFTRRALAWRARGLFPDLLGPGNLAVVEEHGAPHLRLIDYGILGTEENPASEATRAAIASTALRLETLLVLANERELVS